MSQATRDGCIVFECDGCGETFTGEPGEDFNTVWEAAKRDGWRTRKIGRDWIHACADDRLDK